MKPLQHSRLATKLLGGLSGLEIGGAAHNPFGLNTKNVDYTDALTVFKREEVALVGKYMPVDIVANGDDIPVEDDSQDFVISSHVIEHFWDPIKAIKEWHRVTKPGGYIFIIAPHKDRTFDKNRPVTSATEIMNREGKPKPAPPKGWAHDKRLQNAEEGHWSVWIPGAFVTLCKRMNWEIHTVQEMDDKVGNGFTVVLRVP